MSEKGNEILLKFSNFDFSGESEHINKMIFSGACLPIGVPSDGIPCGADKPVVFAPEAALKALDTFAGMGVDCVYDSVDYPECVLTGHDHRFKIGVVDGATIRDDFVNITGHLWVNDFYDVCFMIKNAKDSLGFSVEVKVTDMEEDNDYWYVKDFTFTGVAILYKNLAAFKETQLAASRKRERDGEELMDEKTISSIVEAVKAGIDFGSIVKEAIAPIEERLGKLEEKEMKVDFSEINTKLDNLEAKFAEKNVHITVPERKTNKTDVDIDSADKETLAESIKKIDENVMLSASEKMAQNMKAWHESLKA